MIEDYWVQNLYSLPKVTATPRLGLVLHHQILYHKSLSLSLSLSHCLTFCGFVPVKTPAIICIE